MVRYSQALFGQSSARLDPWRIPPGVPAVLMRARPEERMDLKVAALDRVLTSGLDAPAMGQAGFGEYITGTGQLSFEGAP